MKNGKLEKIHENGKFPFLDNFLFRKVKEVSHFSEVDL